VSSVVWLVRGADFVWRGCDSWGLWVAGGIALGRERRTQQYIVYK
jgi:hypothetical protein